MSSGFVVDLHRCIGCAACVLACRLENDWPAGAAWRRVAPLNHARRPNGPTYFLSVACHHCEAPACVAACPSNAYVQRPDGIVEHLADRCLGCRYCEMACPFDAPRFDEARGVMGKCGLCAPRLDAGDPPACVAACPTEALRFSTAPPSPEAGARDVVPGFADWAATKPRTRFLLPRGRRAALLAALDERLKQE